MKATGLQCVHGARGCRRVRAVPAAEPRRRACRCRAASSRSRAAWATGSSGTCCWWRCRCCTAPRALRPAAVMALTGALGVLIYALLKRVFVRERPFITHAGHRPRGAPLDRYSFPSGHTLHAVSFTWQAGAHFPELLLVLLPLAALIAASRVVLGLHYPSDVLAGAATRGRARRAGPGARLACRASAIARTLPRVADTLARARPAHLRCLLPARQRRLHLHPHLPRRPARPGRADPARRAALRAMRETCRRARRAAHPRRRGAGGS